MSRDFLTDTVRYAPAQIVPALVSFVSIPIVTRRFTPETYAPYSVAMATVMVIVVLMGWLPMAVIRFYPVYEKGNQDVGMFRSTVVRAMIWFVLAVGTVYTVVLKLLAGRLSSELALLLWAGLVLVVCLGVSGVLQHFLRMTRRIALYSAYVSWHSIGGLGLGLILIFHYHSGIEGLLFGSAISLIVVLPVLWRQTVGPSVRPSKEFANRTLREMAAYSIPLVGTNLAAWILRLSDRYILQSCRGSGEVGVYAASYNISDNCLLLLLMLIVVASGPLLTQRWEHDGIHAAGQLLNQVTRFFLLLCIPAAAGITVLSKPLVVLLTDTPYHDGHRIMGYVAAGALLLGLQQRFQMPFLFLKRTGELFAVIVIAALTNVVLNVLLVPRWGYMAAAATTLCAYTVLAFTTIVLSRRLLLWHFPAASCLRASLATVAMALTVRAVIRMAGETPLEQICLGIATALPVYGLVLILLREFSSDELGDACRGFRHVLKRIGLI